MCRCWSLDDRYWSLDVEAWPSFSNSVLLKFLITMQVADFLISSRSTIVVIDYMKKAGKYTKSEYKQLNTYDKPKKL